MGIKQRIAALRFDFAAMRHAPRFAREVRRAKDRYIKDQVEYWKRHGGMSDRLEAEHMRDMEAVFDNAYRRIMASAVDATPATVDGLKSAPTLETKRQAHEEALSYYYRKYGGRRAKDTATTTTADIRRLLMRAFEDGEPEAVVVRQGLQAMALSAWRADTIARTETHLAASFAQKFTVDQIGRDNGLQFEKAWAPTIDDRTREAHASMDADNYIAEGEQFTVDGERMDYPGDPTGSAENVINCRCVCLRRVKD